jgi:hypothetical protein
MVTTTTATTRTVDTRTGTAEHETSINNQDRLPLRFLGETKQGEDAVCWFCLETSCAASSQQEANKTEANANANQIASNAIPLDTTDDRFIAPCACTGSAEYVHVKCLRKWQMTQLRVGVPRRQQQRNETAPSGTKRGWVCQICTIPYSLRPPVLKPHLIQQATLLVYTSQNPNPNSTFDKTIVLMLTAAGSQHQDVDQQHMGIILNKQPHHIAPTTDAAESMHTLTSLRGDVNTVEI